MKIINDNIAYVQKRDIGNISTYDMPMPSNIFLMTLNESRTSNNKNDFVSFTDKQEIDFFKNVSWILNYDEVINIEAEDIALQIQELILRRNKMVNEFDFNSVESILKLDLGKECNKIDLMIESLKYTLKVKNGDIKITLPDTSVTNIKNNCKTLKKGL